jgi:hypothetical protein
MDFIQKVAVIGALWEYLFLNAILAGAFHEVADFEIISVFELFFCHQFPGTVFGLMRKFGFLKRFPYHRAANITSLNPS